MKDQSNNREDSSDELSDDKSSSMSYEDVLRTFEDIEDVVPLSATG